MTTNHQRPQKRQTNKIGNGFRATVIAFSLTSLVVAWDMVARRDMAKALAEEVTPTSPPSPAPWPTPTPWPTLAPLAALPPGPTLPPLPAMAEGMADEKVAASSVPVAAVSVAPPPSAPAMPTMAPLPEMP
ncbi:MAG: hypothetical protein P8186_30025, partial [Anaerolineae bacterium]